MRLVVRLTDTDDAAPTLLSASVDGATLTLTFGEALDEDSKPPASALAVRVGETARAVEAVAISGNTALLTLSPAVTAEDTVTVDYAVPEDPEAAGLQDGAGNRVASFAATEAENGTAPALPAVSIAAASTPVTEGAAAAFVLRRTGATAAALTVSVSVSEAGSVLSGAPPSSATFAAGSAEARLSVATANDEDDEGRLDQGRQRLDPGAERHPVDRRGLGSRTGRRAPGRRGCWSRTAWAMAATGVRARAL